VELGPPLRLAAFGASIFALSILACEAPAPSAFESEVRLPPRSAPVVDAGTSDNTPPVESETPDADAGKKDEEPVDPCAAPGLVACLTFEDAVTDAKGKLVPSEVTGVTYVAGKTGKGARLGITSGGSRVRFMASDSLATAETTVEAWVKLDPTFGEEATIFHAAQRWVMTIEADRTLLCGSPGGAARGHQVTLDKWVHIACVFGGGSVKAYVDGAAGQVTGSFTGMPPASPTLAELGSDPPDGTRPFFGAIDTLRIFSTPRTPTQIATAAKP
jgi:hypothetical protein